MCACVRAYILLLSIAYTLVPSWGVFFALRDLCCSTALSTFRWNFKMKKRFSKISVKQSVAEIFGKPSVWKEKCSPISIWSHKCEYVYIYIITYFFSINYYKKKSLVERKKKLQKLKNFLLIFFHIISYNLLKK